MSLLAGALKTEERMEVELNKMADDFYDTYRAASELERQQKLQDISKFMQRDLRAMFILNNAIDLTTKNSTLDDFQKAIKAATLKNELEAPRFNRNAVKDAANPVKMVRGYVNDHVQLIRSGLLGRVGATVEQLRYDQKRQKVKESRAKANYRIVTKSVESAGGDSHSSQMPTLPPLVQTTASTHYVPYQQVTN